MERINGKQSLSIRGKRFCQAGPGLCVWLGLMTLLALLSTMCGYAFAQEESEANTPIEVNLDADVIAGPAPLTVNFVGSTTDSGGTLKQYYWVFEMDVTSGIGYVSEAMLNISAQYTYSNAGVHEAQFRVSDGLEEAFASKIISVWTSTPTNTPTSTPTRTHRPKKPTRTPKETPTITPTGEPVTATPTRTPKPTRTQKPTKTPIDDTPTITPTGEPLTATPTRTPRPTRTRKPTKTPRNL